jgi:hypothetical protein
MDVFMETVVIQGNSKLNEVNVDRNSHSKVKAGMNPVYFKCHFKFRVPKTPRMC